MPRVGGYRWQDQLTQDLASGNPIPYRRVPGTGSHGPFYNPKTGQQYFTGTNIPISEDYVLRHYRPALLEQHGELIYQQEITNKGRTYAALQASNRTSLAKTYLTKQIAESGPLTTMNDIYNDQQFNDLYNALRVASFRARHTTVASLERVQAFAADSDYANLLVALGRRLPNEDFNVGMSPKGQDEGSYIDSYVTPYYQNMIQGG